MNAKTVVARGAQLLDEHRPDWPLRIDVDQLQMKSGLTCILGQVFGRYDAGREALRLPYYQNKPALFGFDIDRNYDNADAAYADLRDAWLVEIAERLAAATIPIVVPDEELVTA